MTVSAQGWRVGISIGSASTVAMLRAPGMRPRPILAGGSPRMPSSADPVYPGHRDPLWAGSMLPQHLARIAHEVHRAAGAEPVETTVGCPPEWENSRRSALAEAVTRAGLGGVEVAGEVTAAAACLTSMDGAAVPPGGLLLVFDAGASSCDAGLLRRTADGFETVAFETVDGSGGIQLDTGLVEFLGARIAAGDKTLWHRLMDPLTPVDRAARLLLWEEVRALKHRLSTEPEATLSVPLADTGLTVTREEFEALARPVFDRALRVTREVLGPAAVSAVFLAGGSSRIPLLGRLLTELTGREPITVKDPDLVVAEGCALLERRQAPLIDDDVQFTVYRPLRLPPGRWESMLVFAHKPGPAGEVHERAERSFAGENPSPRTVDSRRPPAPGARLRVVPELPGVECHPPEHVLDRHEPVQELAFRLRVAPTAPEVVRGFVRVWCGPVVIGEVSLALPVTLGDVPVERRPEPIRRYRKIFPSYSGRDRAVAEDFAVAARALGDQYLQDVVTLRSGEQWSPRLLELIEEADIFQLFWSNNSMISDYCRAEWEYALGLGRPSFVRSFYWEDPLPEAPHLGLPPAELRRLHFARVPVAVAAPDPPRAAAAEPAASAPGAPTWSPPPPAAPRSPAPAPDPAPAACLRVVRADGETTTYGLPRQRATIIGTAVNADLRLTDLYASRRHAEITPVRGRFLVDDLGSTNGTTLNGRRVRGREPLRPGDVIGVGKTRLEFSEPADVPATPPAAAPPPAAPANRASAGLVTTGAALAVAGVGWWLLSPYAGTVVGLIALVVGLILVAAGLRRH
ncbi:Hsp70 family protein [Paractinoplanes brasiliensis]|uniref:TIR domain-containing protein n=1 Tax=Paractinoplanes brasiliensis TaxID=52695 RepID=A0A4R6JAW7_9ACTN|nr:Hsp70 family protein [Actinoplanes brasiliensis]TDO32071.1 TIR domain-containing protein [Actinoplanes brasiliensis]